MNLRASSSRLITRWLRDPWWLTPVNVVVFSTIIFGTFALGTAKQLIAARGMEFHSGAPIGLDFIGVYAASAAALKGHAAQAYDLVRHHTEESTLVGSRNAPLLIFSYPPMFLLMVLPLALLSYPAAWVAWEAITFAGYIIVARRIVSGPLATWIAITFPAVIINAITGQNGFLTAALMGGGLVSLEENPAVAGVLFGLLAYKPQYGMLIPLALIAGRQWRALVWTAITVAAFCGASLLCFGLNTWRAFMASIPLTTGVVLERGGVKFYKLQSVFAAVRLWGGNVATAYFFQAIVSVSAVAAVIWIWRSNRPYALKAATLVTAALLATPYILDYDLVVLGLPIAWLFVEGYRRGFLPWEKFGLAVAWLMPGYARFSATIPHLIAPLAMTGLMILIVRRAIQNGGSPEPSLAPASLSQA